MAILVKLVGAQEASALEVREAERRFVQALEGALGDADIVASVYRAYLQLRSVYGENPDLQGLTSAESTIYEQWQGAQSLALVAALGPHRYLDEPQFELAV